jgi:fatty acid desaturase
MNIKRLSDPSSLRWLSLVFVDWFFIVGAFGTAYYFQNVLAYWLASLVIGNRLHALSIMGHDGAHRTASKRKSLNDILVCLFAFWPLGTGLNGYRDFHFTHHRNVGTSSDPELKHKQWLTPQFGLPQKPSTLLKYVLKDLIGFGYKGVSLFFVLVKPRSILDIAGPLLMISSFWLVCLLTANGWILALWYFSILTSFWACFRLRVWIEHVGTRSTHRVHLDYWAGIVFAPHGAGYHFEHHQWPSVPCWNLAKARHAETLTSILTLSQMMQFYENHSSLSSGALPDVQEEIVVLTDEPETDAVADAATAPSR